MLMGGFKHVEIWVFQVFDPRPLLTPIYGLKEIEKQRVEDVTELKHCDVVYEIKSKDRRSMYIGYINSFAGVKFVIRIVE